MQNIKQNVNIPANFTLVLLDTDVGRDAHLNRIRI